MNKKTQKLTYDFRAMNSDERLRELILYISEKCCDDPSFGATKLNKILFFSDFISYFETGKPITGAAYMKLPQGPAPKRLVPIRENMKKQGEIAVSEIQCGPYTKNQIIPNRRAKLSQFNAEEIANVERVIKALWGHTASAVSKISHQRAWRIAEDNKLIPYEAALLSDEPTTDYEINRTKELAHQYGWGN
jgi:hypothetical protein